MPCNAQPLSYWSQHSYTAADVQTVMEELEAHNIMAVALEFQENANLHCILTKRYGERFKTEGHLPAIVRLFSGIHRDSGGQTLRGRIVVWAEDHIWGTFQSYSERVPLFAFGRGLTDQATLLIPDPAFIMTGGYTKDRTEIEEMWQLYPWEKKQPTVFWRGATSGYGFELDNWQGVPRMTLCLIARELADPSRLDAGFSKVIQFSNPEHEKRILDLDVLRGPIPFRDFLKYRYQVDVDGFANAWSSCFLKLASHCLTLKVASSSMQWYYDELVPWQNFVPVEGNLSNLREILDWLSHSDDEARKIAERAFALTEKITLKDATEHVAHDLAHVLARQKT